MIQHSVIFKLKHAKGSKAEKRFMEAAMNLASIPGVLNFKRFRQTSKKNTFDYGLVMEFESTMEYEAYNQHSEHQGFIRDYWMDSVDDFLEIDYEPLH
ncbi:MAG: Dabb family protein [Eudoraea sp.]|jgi:heme-degrading monooxygenase HmoA|uniref:Dabb family protein n=1 Tax=Eudoraea sp. TaxID=1979955 RepID=UPI003C777BFE